MDLEQIIKYLTKDIDNTRISYVLRDDGGGPYIAFWGVYGLTQPTEQELLDVEASTNYSNWLSELNNSKISYYDFFELLPVDLQVAVTNEAERRLRLDPPDSEMMVMLRKTYDKTQEINLTSSATIGNMTRIVQELVDENILTVTQAGQWKTSQQVT